MKVLITDKINEAAGKILDGVAQVDFLPTMSEDELAEKIKEYEERIHNLEERVYQLEKFKNQAEADIYRMKIILERISPNSGLIERWN